jgi:hypothetical protein
MTNTAHTQGNREIHSLTKSLNVWLKILYCQAQWL